MKYNTWREAEVNPYFCVPLHEAPEGASAKVSDGVKRALRGRALEFSEIPSLKVIILSGEEARKQKPEFQVDDQRLGVVFKDKKVFILDPHNELDDVAPSYLGTVVANGVRESLDGAVLEARMEVFVALRNMARLRDAVGEAWNRSSRVGKVFDEHLLGRAEKEAGVEGPELERAKSDLRHVMNVEFGLTGNVDREFVNRLSTAHLQVLCVDETSFKIMCADEPRGMVVRIAIPKRFLYGRLKYRANVAEALKAEYIVHLHNVAERAAKPIPDGPGNVFNPFEDDVNAGEHRGTGSGDLLD